MSKKKRNMICIVLIILLSLIVGAVLVFGNHDEKDPSVSTKTKEEIFTKTIHDFGNLRVDNLDDQENTNFVVYAEGIQEIIMTQDRNVLVEVDKEELSYTFTHADDTLKSMEKGDVFFGVHNDGNADSVTAMVKKIDVSGDRVTVYSEEIGLSDLFVYVDIYMDIPLNQPGTDAASLSNNSRQGTYGLTLLGAAEELNALDIYEKTLEQPISINKGPVTVSGELSATLKVKVEWRYDAESNQLHTGLWTDVELEHSINIAASGHVKEKMEFMPIPIPIAGPLRLMLQPAVILTADAVVSGTFSYEAQDKYGYTLVFSNGDVKAEPHKEISTPTITGGFGKLEANIGLALELRPYYRLGFIGELYASINGGVELACVAGPVVEIPEQMDAPAIHTCDACIDGELNLFAEISVGYEMRLGKKSAGKEQDDEENELSDELSLYHPDKWKINDFYISFMDGLARMGWGECPNWRYRSVVTVVNQDDKPVSGAEVTAKKSDEVVESTIADNSGQAILYLPAGEHVLEARKDDFVSSAPALVEQSSAESPNQNTFSIALNITEPSGPFELYFIFNNGQDDEITEFRDFSELVNLILSKYDPQYHPSAFPTGYRPTDLDEVHCGYEPNDNHYHPDLFVDLHDRYELFTFDDLSITLQDDASSSDISLTLYTDINFVRENGEYLEYVSESEADYICVTFSYRLIVTINGVKIYDVNEDIDSKNYANRKEAKADDAFVKDLMLQYAQLTLSYVDMYYR